MQWTTLSEQVREAHPHAVAIRHELHRHPELGYQEFRTSEVIQRELEELRIEVAAGLAGGTGVLAHLPATTRNPGQAATIALRADIDALPIHEETQVDYASQNPGVMHACGHDGHTAILLNTARILSRWEQRPNNVTFLFQPAEEGGAGADRMCKDGALSGDRLGTPVDLIYGLHGWPGLTESVVATRTGPLLAATDEFDIKVRGRQCHAAYPHLGVDSILVASHIITALQSIAARSIDPLDSIVVTVGAFHAGTARNVIPAEALLKGTMRTLRPESRQQGEQRLRALATHIAQAHDAEVEVTWRVGYPVTFNHADATDRFRRIAADTLGADRLLQREQPTMGGEDFSFYGHHVPACFFFLGLQPEGQHDYPNLHTPRFDFNDNVIPTGVELMCRLALTDHA